MSKKQFILGIIITFVFIFTVAQVNIRQVFSLDGSHDILSIPQQTIPSRTPTPGPNPPTNTPAPKPTSSGGGEPATAVPTSTLPAQPTNTATPPVTIAYTPVGGFVPTAESCGVPPTIKVQNPTNVRQGPGIDYPVVGQLVFLEVRFILGRAADAAWWLVQLDDNTGWVADNVVTIQGYIGGVPIVPAPAVDGQTPTPGTLWNPTPLPFCTVTPTATTVPTNTPSPTTAVTEALPSLSSAETATEPALPTETPLPQPTQTAVAPPTLIPATATNQSVTISAAQITTDPVETADAGSATDWLLPAAGLLLVAGGTAAYFTRRKN